MSESTKNLICYLNLKAKPTVQTQYTYSTHIASLQSEMTRPDVQTTKVVKQRKSSKTTTTDNTTTDKPKRQPTPYNNYIKHYYATFKQNNPDTKLVPKDMIKAASALWKAMSPDEKLEYKTGYIKPVPVTPEPEPQEQPKQSKQKKERSSKKNKAKHVSLEDSAHEE
jgi:HMG (high mobility group) box